MAVVNLCLFFNRAVAVSRQADRLTTLGPIGTESPIHVSYLNPSKLVTGAYLLSNGDCLVTNSFRVKINSSSASSEKGLLTIFQIHIKLFCLYYSTYTELENNCQFRRQ